MKHRGKILVPTNDKWNLYFPNSLYRALASGERQDPGVSKYEINYQNELM